MAGPGALLTPAGAAAHNRLLAATPSTPLLPAFEPVSSSPAGLPRPPKRKMQDDGTRDDDDADSDDLHLPVKTRLAAALQYPTPNPTSAAPVPSSSPHPRKTRPPMQRSLSTVSERQPLSQMPEVRLHRDGATLTMGRSSHSSTYQLSANRLISRVHVEARYRPAAAASGSEPARPPAVVVECVGWNGCKVHCRGQVYDLKKGDSFTSEKPLADILLDVQDARVLVRWPWARHTRNASAAGLSDSTWSDGEQDGEQAGEGPAGLAGPATPPAAHLPSSPPLPMPGRLASPESPTPASQAGPAGPLSNSQTFIADPLGLSDSPVRVYEDASGDEEADGQAAEPATCTKAASSSPLSALSADASDLSDDAGAEDTENDPVIAAFGSGVGGANLLPRMAAMAAAEDSPSARRPLAPTRSPRQPQGSPSQGSPSHGALAALAQSLDLSPIRNHVINQLAFSRLRSLPLSTLLGNLPASMRAAKSTGPSDDVAFDQPHLKLLLDDIACVGQIAREGNDAAGKPLETEFYYLPELDADAARRDAVEHSLGKPGLRAVRKQHKVRRHLDPTDCSNTFGSGRGTDLVHERDSLALQARCQRPRLDTAGSLLQILIDTRARTSIA